MLFNDFNIFSIKKILLKTLFNTIPNTHTKSTHITTSASNHCCLKLNRTRITISCASPTPPQILYTIVVIVDLDLCRC